MKAHIIAGKEFTMSAALLVATAFVLAAGCGSSAPDGSTAMKMVTPGDQTMASSSATATKTTSYIGTSSGGFTVYSGNYYAGFIQSAKDSSGSYQISLKWNAEWPDEAGSDLTADALVAVRSTLLDDVFGHLDIENTNTFDTALENALALAAKKTNTFFEKQLDTSACEYALDFTADLKLSWPFGRLEDYDSETMPRPILVAVNNGYENEGGSGCHSYVTARVFDLPSGRLLKESDFFRADAMDPLFREIIRRVCASVTDIAPQENADPKPGCGNFAVEKGGIRWFVPAYSMFPGCVGVTSAFISWEDLREYLIPEFAKLVKSE